MNLNRAYRAAALSILAAAMVGGLTACNDQDKTKDAAATTQSAPAESGHHLKEHAAATPTCGNCGTVSAIHLIKEEGKASGAGAVGGAVVGGVLGHQAGKGHGKDAMTALGAIGGAVAGNYAEKQIRATHHYEVSVLFEDGRTQTFKFKEKPGFQEGDHVKSKGGSLVAE